MAGVVLVDVREQLARGHVPAVKHVYEALHDDSFVLDIALATNLLSHDVLFTAEIVSFEGLLVLLISNIATITHIFVKNVQQTLDLCL